MSTPPSAQQIGHLTGLLQQKFISPYKVIYSLDPQQADHFKARNQSRGCCASASITIPPGQRTKTESFLADMITGAAVRAMLGEVFEYCEARYLNVVANGKKDGLKTTPEVEKYLLDSVMAEAVNTILSRKLAARVTQQSKSMSTGIALWATPATWYAQYPQIKLQMFDVDHLDKLFNGKYTVVEDKLQPYLAGSFAELQLLEKDGRLQAVNSAESGQTKVLSSVFTFANSNKDYLPNLYRFGLLLQSIPFELNLKSNSYLTINDSTQILYYPRFIQCPKRIIQGYDFQVSACFTAQLTVNVGNESFKLKQGSVFIAKKGIQYGFKSEGIRKDNFVFKYAICSASKQERKQ